MEAVPNRRNAPNGIAIKRTSCAITMTRETAGHEFERTLLATGAAAAAITAAPRVFAEGAPPVSFYAVVEAMGLCFAITERRSVRYSPASGEPSLPELNTRRAMSVIEIHSTRPCSLLRPFVRSYAQRVTALREREIFEGVPARLEPTLEFELGDLFQVEFVEGSQLTSPPVGIIGPQSCRRGIVRLTGMVDCFAIFFQPTGFTRLFGLPLGLLLDNAFDAVSLIGRELPGLRDRLGECATFAARVGAIEEALCRRAMNAVAARPTDRAAQCLFAEAGAPGLGTLARDSNMSYRHFERRFISEFGMTPKKFARIARFQRALDAGAARPDKTWCEIAHEFGYYDQAHMARDFISLGGATPKQVLHFMGDMRPQALIRQDTNSRDEEVYRELFG
jgi:AraC-like DNA-binding protein